MVCVWLPFIEKMLHLSENLRKKLIFIRFFYVKNGEILNFAFLDLRFYKNAHVAALFGHHGFEARKVVAYIGVEQVIAAKDNAVIGERERPMEF